MNRKRYNVVISTRFGSVIANHYDRGVFWQLSQTGKYDESQIELIRRCVSFCPTDPIVLDIGANIGLVSLSLADLVGGGAIFAFEPQRIIFQMLAGNMAINSIENVFCYHLAVGDTNGTIPVPRINYGAGAIFGSLELGREVQSDLGQNARLEGPDVETVRMVTIDSLNFSRVDLMKIDVEGMEEAVLRGAQSTIMTSKPLLYVETLKSDKDRLAAILTAFGYSLHRQGENYLCLHRDRPSHMEADRLLRG